MDERDRKPFYALVADVYGFYRIDCSQFAYGVWWEGCKPFDLAAVRDAFNRHAVNPDNGQFLPKPADIVKLIGGTTTDGAQLAWVKVDRAVRSVGPWQTPVFDDPIVHAVIADMGGWKLLCDKDYDAWPFVQREFETRYRGYRTAGHLESVPALTGIIGAENGKHGVDDAYQVLVGAPDKARRVLALVTDEPRLQMTRVDEAAVPALPARSAA